MKFHIVFALTTLSFVAADLINGGFESGCPDPNNNCLSVHSLPGWTVASGDIDMVGNSYWNSHSGSWSIDLDGSSGGDSAQGVLTQDVCTTVGATYTITWWMSYNPDSAPGASFPMSVQATGSNAQTFTATHPPSAPRVQYTQYTYSFVASATTTTVTIASLISGNYGPVIDDVSINGDTTQPPCVAPPSTPSEFCNQVSKADWTYGQGYYCWNGQQGFIQCWGDDVIYSAYQDCPAGTACICSDDSECSNHGTESPCQ